VNNSHKCQNYKLRFFGQRYDSRFQWFDTPICALHVHKMLTGWGKCYKYLGSLIKIGKRNLVLKIGIFQYFENKFVIFKNEVSKFH